MFFPIINAVDDGVFLYVWLAASAGMYGCEWWSMKHDFFGTMMTKS
jgi:hypothetical protein